MTRQTDEQLDVRYTTQGYAAYWAGKTAADNPHEPGFRNHEMWNTGWLNAAAYEAQQKEDVAKMKAEMDAAKQRRTDKQKRGAANKAARAEANRAAQRAKTK